MVGAVLEARAYGKPILKNGVRILRPVEFLSLREGANNFSHENGTNLDATLTTGMRYVEARRLQRHPEWFDGTFVYLPQEAQLKEKSQQKERWIRMGQAGVAALAAFWTSRALPGWQTWRENLVRWAETVRLDPVGLSSKTMRKTYEAWLVKYYPERQSEIFMRQGHTSITSLKYYLNLPFTDADTAQMEPWVKGVF
jgi:integrase